MTTVLDKVAAILAEKKKPDFTQTLLTPDAYIVPIKTPNSKPKTDTLADDFREKIERAPYMHALDNDFEKAANANTFFIGFVKIAEGLPDTNFPERVLPFVMGGGMHRVLMAPTEHKAGEFFRGATSDVAHPVAAGLLGAAIGAYLTKGKSKEVMTAGATVSGALGAGLGSLIAALRSPKALRSSIDKKDKKKALKDALSKEGAAKTVKEWKKDMKEWGTKDLNRACRADLGEGSTKKNQDFAIAARSEREGRKKLKKTADITDVLIQNLLEAKV